MADFVNYNKREVTLPAGCKDLIDVLRPREGKPAGRRAESGIGPLSEIAEHVQGVFDSRGRISALQITSPDGRIAANVRKKLGKHITALVTFQRGSEQEKAVRDFLASRGMQPPRDSEAPKLFFFPDLPVQMFCEISPLSPDPLEVSRLILDLFRRVGLKDDALMDYHYFEVSGDA